MRKVLLASAVFILAGTGSAFAVVVDDTDILITSHLDQACSIDVQDADVVVGPDTTPAPGTFTTTCNFEDAPSMTIKFSSLSGGVFNSAEGVTVDYLITYEGGPSQLASLSDGGSTFDVTAAPGPTANLPVSRDFTVALVEALSIAGDYQDTLSINVIP